MPNKSSSQNGGFDLMSPVIEIFSELLVQASKYFYEGSLLFINRYILKIDSSSSFKKIERKDLSKSKKSISDSAIGYSLTTKRELMGNNIVRSDHTAIVGASGAGKTVLLDTLMYDDLRNGKPVVYIDPKGDNETLLTFINLCILTGRDYAIFSEYYNGHGACKLNPVKDGTVTNITDRIFDSFIWSEEHYAQICYDALEDSIKKLLKESKQVTIENIHNELLTLSDSSNKSKCIYKRDEVRGILSRLRKYINSDYGDKLKGINALSFLDIRNSKKCVYIGLSVLGYSKMARSLGKIILGDVAYCAYATYKSITPTSKDDLTSLGLYIDELSAIITPNEFIELLNKIRGAKMELTFGFQSPSDIKKVDQELLIQVLENTSNWFIFKQRMREGAQLFSDSIGTNESTKQTMRIQDGEELAHGSQRTVEELTAHSNIIKNLGKGQCILLRHYPTRLDLLNVKYLDPKIVWKNVEILKKEGLLNSKEKNQSLETQSKKNDTGSNDFNQWGEEIE